MPRTGNMQLNVPLYERERQRERESKVNLKILF